MLFWGSRGAKTPLVVDKTYNIIRDNVRVSRLGFENLHFRCEEQYPRWHMGEKTEIILTTNMGRSGGRKKSTKRYSALGRSDQVCIIHHSIIIFDRLNGFSIRFNMEFSKNNTRCL